MNDSSRIYVYNPYTLVLCQLVSNSSTIINESNLIKHIHNENSKGYHFCLFSQSNIICTLGLSSCTHVSSGRIQSGERCFIRV